MEIKVKNLGALKQAEFSLGDLTILCGGNNTGKTYATYALFGFLFTWRQMISIEIEPEKIKQLLAIGVITIDIQEYVDRLDKIIVQACQTYTQQLPKIFASPSERFKETEFQLKLNTTNINFTSKFERKMSATNAELFSIIKNENTTEIIITLLYEKEKVKIPTEIINHIISDTIKDMIFNQLIPKPFIASAERTGAAIFRKELNFARNRALPYLW